MKRFFFQKDMAIKLAILSLVLLIVLPIEFFLLWLFLLGLTFFLFRRNAASHKNSLSSSVDIVLSPVTGIVDEIVDEQNTKKIKISIPVWGPFGLYMPNSSEITRSEKLGTVRFWRKRKISQFSGNNERAQVELINKLGQKVSLQVLRCVYGLPAQLWPRAGDKGRSCALMGVFPFGGSIIVEVPAESEILVVKSERVKAGFTILAGMKG